MIGVNDAYRRSRYEKKKMVEKFACNVQHISFCHARPPAYCPNMTYFRDLCVTHMDQIAEFWIKAEDLHPCPFIVPLQANVEHFQGWWK